MNVLHFLWYRFSSSYELRSFTFLFVYLFHINMVWRGYPYSTLESVLITALALVLGLAVGLLFRSRLYCGRVPVLGLIDIGGRDLFLLILLHPSTLVCFVLFIHLFGAAVVDGGVANWFWASCALVLGPAGAILSTYVSEVVRIGDVRE